MSLKGMLKCSVWMRSEGEKKSQSTKHHSAILVPPELPQQLKQISCSKGEPPLPEEQLPASEAWLFLPSNPSSPLPPALLARSVSCCNSFLQVCRKLFFFPSWFIFVLDHHAKVSYCQKKGEGERQILPQQQQAAWSAQANQNHKRKVPRNPSPWSWHNLEQVYLLQNSGIAGADSSHDTHSITWSYLIFIIQQCARVSDTHNYLQLEKVKCNHRHIQKPPSLHTTILLKH